MLEIRQIECLTIPAAGDTNTAVMPATDVVAVIVKKKTNATLLHRSWGLVAGFGDDLIFDRLPLFVFHGQRLVGGRIHELHFNLAELPIVGLVARLVGQHVLITQCLMDRPEDRGIFALKAREISRSARFLAKVRIMLSA